MAVLTGKKSITQTDYLHTDDGVTHVPVKDVFGGTATVYAMHQVVPSGVTYLRIYDDPDPTVGTTEPDFIFRMSEEAAWTCIEGIEFTNFSYAAVTQSGTAGATVPTVTVALHCVVR